MYNSIMEVKCTFDRQSVLNQLSTPLELARRRLAERVLADSNIFIPVDTGALRASGYVDSEYAVVWPKDYAARVFYATENNLHIHTEKNPNATERWFEVAYNLKYMEWVEVVQKILAPRHN